MNKQSVKKRIFISNTLMILVTLILFFMVNIAVVKIYTESVEREFEASVNQVVDGDDLKDLIKDWTIKKNEFISLFVVDGIICVIGLVAISQIFTKNLSNHILEPLDELCDGATRVKNNHLTQDISYTGDLEFERVCQSFNDMQKHILDEQEKNRKYEQARTDMIAGISHDLRTPLTAIKGSIKGVLDGVASTPEMQQKFLNTAYKRSDEMDILLNQLFYLSKLETGNMPLNMKKVNLTEYLEKYVANKKEVLGLKEVSISLNVQEEKCYVMIDPEQLQRILDNLLENSIKYGDKPFIHLDITLIIQQGHLSLVVSDDGMGVEEDKLQHIFEEFYRGDDSRNNKEGKGLGLYIVKYLVDAMGGTIQAYNKNGLVIDMKFPFIACEEGYHG